MTITYSNPGFSDDERRFHLYDGQVFLYSSRPESRALIEFAQELIGEAFGALDPETAQHDLPVEKFAAILSELKPRFIHHPRAKELLQALLGSFGCDAEKTYFDVPRMRSSTSDDYLTSGIAYAFHPHRDTWYSAPLSQANWWIPIFEVVPENVMTFHPRYWNSPVKNGSHRYDYYEWNNTSRFNAAQHIGKDTREQPKPEEPIELEPRVTLVPEPGGVMIFSGNQLHSSVPNTSGRTRFSIDFRTVHLDDVIARREASNVDCACTGTTLRDFLRVSDLERMPENVALAYEGKG
jgi:Phytanoyl-CoA dioxygenase (PhyH)